MDTHQSTRHHPLAIARPSLKHHRKWKKMSIRPSKRKVLGLFLLVSLLLAGLFLLWKKPVSKTTVDTTQLDYHQEKVAEGAYVLRDRETIKQTIKQVKQTDVRLKENKNAVTMAKDGKEAYNWTVTLPTGTVFAFGKQTDQGILPVVKVTASDGKFVRYYPQTEQLRPVKPQVKDNVVSWEISPGITARYTMQHDRVKADYLVRDRETLQKVTDGGNGLDFVIEHDQSLSPELLPDGNISWITYASDEVGNSKGTEKFKFPIPVIVEQSKAEWEGNYKLQKTSDGVSLLSITLPKEQLDVAMFPLVIDPQTVDSSALSPNAYGNSRHILRDGWGNLIVITETNPQYYKNYNSSTWTSCACGGVTFTNTSSELDSTGNIHVVHKITGNPMAYGIMTVTRNADNTISSISSPGSLQIDSTNGGKPSLIVANKGMGAGKEKVVISWASNTTNRGEIRIMQCDIADDCTSAANWKNVSEEKNGSGGVCADTNTAGAKGLATSGTCKGTNDAVLATATTVQHHGVLTQMPMKPRRSSNYVMKRISGVFTDMTTNTTDGNGGTTDNVNSLNIGDAIFVGSDTPFSKISVDMVNTNSNSAGLTNNTYAAEDGSGNCTSSGATPGAVDNTMAGIVTLSEDGSFLFNDTSPSWVKCKVNGIDAYWVRLDLNAALDSTVSIAEVYVNDRNSGALLMIGGDSGTSDLRTAYVPWDDVGQAGWENNPSSVASPWRESGTGASSSISDTGLGISAFSYIPLSSAIDYSTNGIYVAYMSGTAVGSSNIAIERATINKDLTAAANWLDTGFPATTEAADTVLSLSADQGNIYLFYVLDPDTNGLSYRRCNPGGGGNGNICDVAADWGPDTTLVRFASTTQEPSHPQTVITKAFGDTVAFDVLYMNNIASPTWSYERHFVDLADVSNFVSASGDDAYVLDCSDANQDDQILTTGNYIGAAFGSCTGTEQNHAGLRFPSVNVAQGTTISSAYLDFYVSDLTSTSPFTFTIYGEDVDSSSAFTAQTNCTDPCTTAVHGRTRTTNSITYSIPVHTYRFRVDVTSLVQEIVCRGAAASQPCVGNNAGSGAWASGNNLTLLLINGNSLGTGYFALDSFDLNTAFVPRLQINTGTGSRNYSMGSATQIASGSASYVDLDHPLSNSQMSALSANDDNFASVAATMNYASGSAKPSFLFKTQNTNNNNTYQVTGSVNVKSTSPPSSNPLYLQVYRGGDIQENVIDTSTNGYATGVNSGNSQARKSFYDTTNNLWWVFYYNGTAIEYSNSPNGKTWTSRGTIAVATTDFSIWYAEDIGTVYIAYESSGVGIRVQKGTLGSTSISWGSAVTAANDDDFGQPSISRDSNGRLWIAYYAQPGACTGSSTVQCPQNYFAKRSTNVDDVSTWGSAQTLLLTGGLDALTQVQVVPMTTSGDMFFVYTMGEINFIIYGRIWDDSAGSLGSEQMSGVLGYGFSVVAGSNDTAHVIVARNAPSTVRYMPFTSGTWGSAVTLGTVNTNDPAIVNVSIDTATNELYALWPYGSSILMSKGISPYTSNDWSSPTKIQNNINSSTTAGYNLTVPYKTSNQFVGIVTTDGTTSPYNVEFNGYALDQTTKNKWETVATNNSAAADTEVTMSATVVDQNLSDYYLSEVPGLSCTSSSVNCWTYWRVYQDLDTSTNGQVLSIDTFSTLYEAIPPSQISFTNSPRTLTGSACGGAGQSFTMELRDVFGNVANATTSTVVRVNSNSTGETIYSNATCTTPVSNGDFTFAIGENAKTFYVLDTDASAMSWTMSATRQSGHTLTTGTQNYSMSGPTKIVFTNQAHDVYKNTCSAAYTMELQDASNVAANPALSTVVRVTSDSIGETIYSDATCTTPVSNGDFTYTTGQNSKTFYIIDTVAAPATLSGVRQSGVPLTTGTQVYNGVETPSNNVRGGVNFRGGINVR